MQTRGDSRAAASIRLVVAALFAVACARAVPPTAPDAITLAIPTGGTHPVGASGIAGQFIGLGGHQATGGVSVIGGAVRTSRK